MAEPTIYFFVSMFDNGPFHNVTRNVCGCKVMKFNFEKLKIESNFSTAVFLIAKQ